MANNTLADLVVIIDSRENRPWQFKEEVKKAGEVRIAGSVVETLDYGDYSVKGMEEIVRIEKKSGFKELFGNMTPKNMQDRFEREMEKMSKLPHKYLFIETSLSHDILGLSIPQFRMGPPASRVLNWVINIQQKYGVIPLFVGECGERTAKMIFKDLSKRYL